MISPNILAADHSILLIEEEWNGNALQNASYGIPANEANRVLESLRSENLKSMI